MSNNERHLTKIFKELYVINIIGNYVNLMTKLIIHLTKIFKELYVINVIGNYVNLMTKLIIPTIFLQVRVVISTVIREIFKVTCSLNTVITDLVLDHF